MSAASSWPAPAKINLFLHVVGRRADGYHLLQTVFQFVDYGDDIAIVVRDDGEVRRLNALAGVDPEQDLVVRAARLLKEATGSTAGADLTVTKRIPMGGGLGGGSSDAATVLVALNDLWGTGLDVDTLAALGLKLGADVPVFVRGASAWAEGVGEILHPFPVEEGPILIVTPDCHVDTRHVFTDPQLTRDTPATTMRGFSLAATRNDCEPVTRRLYPAVGAALDWLGQHAPARMSGTGASVFALFADAAEAQAVARQVPAPWAAFCAERRNRSPLLDAVEAWRARRPAR